MKSIASLLVVLILATAARGESPSPAEKRFLRTLVSGLTSESPQVRLGAAEGLITMGDVAAVYIVDQWRRLQSAARKAAGPVLVRIGKPAADAILALASRPTGPAGKDLDSVLAQLVGGGGDAGFGSARPEIAASVRDIMGRLQRGSFTSTEPLVDELIGLGRDAIPALLEYLRPGKVSQDDWTKLRAAEAALGRLCTAKDTARLSRLLDESWLCVAAVMEQVGDRNAVPALIRVLDRGQLSSEVGCALRRFEDPRCRESLGAFLKTHGKQFPTGMMHLLQLASKFRMREAIPAVKAILETPTVLHINQSLHDMLCARALVLLGEPVGIPVLIRLLSPGRYEEWIAQCSGRALNAATGQSFWRDGSDGLEAQAAYLAWWKENQGRLEWDETRREFKRK